MRETTKARNDLAMLLRITIVSVPLLKQDIVIVECLARLWASFG